VLAIVYEMLPWTFWDRGQPARRARRLRPGGIWLPVTLRVGRERSFRLCVCWSNR